MGVQLARALDPGGGGPLSPGCSVPGCDRPHKARGWCQAHYRRWQTHGDVLASRAIGEARPRPWPIRSPAELDAIKARVDRIAQGMVALVLVQMYADAGSAE